MSEYQIINICERPEMKDIAAEWFQAKWGVPLEAYQESIETALTAGVDVYKRQMVAPLSHRKTVQ